MSFWKIFWINTQLFGFWKRNYLGNICRFVRLCSCLLLNINKIISIYGIVIDNRYISIVIFCYPIGILHENSVEILKSFGKRWRKCCFNNYQVWSLGLTFWKFFFCCHTGGILSILSAYCQEGLYF